MALPSARQAIVRVEAYIVHLRFAGLDDARFTRVPTGTANPEFTVARLLSRNFHLAGSRNFRHPHSRHQWQPQQSLPETCISEAPIGIEPMMGVLQTPALPLGDGAEPPGGAGHPGSPGDANVRVQDGRADEPKQATCAP